MTLGLRPQLRTTRVEKRGVDCHPPQVPDVKDCSITPLRFTPGVKGKGPTTQREWNKKEEQSVRRDAESAVTTPRVIPVPGPSTIRASKGVKGQRASGDTGVPE